MMTLVRHWPILQQIKFGHLLIVLFYSGERLQEHWPSGFVVVYKWSPIFV